MTAGRSGRRQVPPQDVARFWQARASGMSIKDAAKIAGVHYNTAQKWDAKKKQAKAELERGLRDLVKAREKDPYAVDNSRRILYEQTLGKKAPTFPVDELNKN